MFFEINDKLVTAEQVIKVAPERFWSKIKFDDPDKCWEWQRYCDTDGYGRFSLKEGAIKISARAHRWLYLFLRNDLQSKLCVLHKCDNRKCVNPNHMFLGTRKNNHDDMVEKNRHYKIPARLGLANNKTKLKDEQVVDIKNRLKNNETQVSLAAEYGVTQAAISLIKLGRNRKYIR